VFLSNVFPDDDDPMPTRETHPIAAWRGPYGDALTNLPVLVVHLQARALAPAPLPPFLGSTLRGALGHSLRALACTTGAPTCNHCPVATRCAYGATWEGAAARNLGSLDRGSDPPRPYVLAWERLASRDRAPTPFLKHGDPLRFRLTLFGTARNHVAHFLAATERALENGLGARRAPFRLEWATTAALTDHPGHPSGRATPLYSEGRVVPLTALPDTTLGSLADHAVQQLGPSLRLAFHTPLHLVADARPLDHIRLDLMTQRLAERVQRLARAWGHDPELAGLPWEELVAMSRDVHIARTQTAWVTFERESSRQQQRVGMGGFIGHVDLNGVPLPLARLFAAAEHVHLGKQATFGFGRISLRRR
jgi:hypothetical protein